MKKVISLLGSITLIATSGISVVACQTKNDEEDPFYQLLTKRPENMEEVKDIIKHYYTLYYFYNDEYWLKDYPKRIKFIDSENAQKMVISIFITYCMCAYAYIYLDFEGTIEVPLSDGHVFSEDALPREKLDSWHQIYIEEGGIFPHAKKTRDWCTNWYNWVLTPQK